MICFEFALPFTTSLQTHIQANVTCLCRNEEVFPEADKFKPERWLDERNEDMGVVNLVWGHGARMCIGRRLAEQEMYLALARVGARESVLVGCYVRSFKGH